MRPRRLSPERTAMAGVDRLVFRLPCRNMWAQNCCGRAIVLTFLFKHACCVVESSTRGTLSRKRNYLTLNDDLRSEQASRETGGEAYQSVLGRSGNGRVGKCAIQRTRCTYTHLHARSVLVDGMAGSSVAAAHRCNPAHYQVLLTCARS